VRAGFASTFSAEDNQWTGEGLEKLVSIFQREER
jgi:hypothetical protein